MHPLSFQCKKDNEVFSRSRYQAKRECKLALKHGRRKKHEHKQFNNKIPDSLGNEVYNCNILQLFT